jgi:hypothetical protein
MRLHSTFAALLTVVAAAPLAAQATQAANRASADPDKNAAGGLRVPGWTARFDRAEAKPAQVSFTRMGTGYHVTAGPAAVYYPTRSAPASGNYTVAASFTQTKAPAHPEAYGLFAGGQNLQGAAPSYVYFVVRGDGKYLVKHRANATEVHTLVDWTASPALKPAGADGKATNALEIRVAGDSVRFVANGTPVAAVSRKQTGALNGTAGIRVNHNLDVHVDGFAVRPAGRRRGARRRGRRPAARARPRPCSRTRSTTSSTSSASRS